MQKSSEKAGKELLLSLLLKLLKEALQSQNHLFKIHLSVFKIHLFEIHLSEIHLSELYTLKMILLLFVTAHAIGCRWRRSCQTLPGTL